MSTKPTLPNANPAELAQMGKKQVEAMIDVQKEFINAIEEVNREWAARVKAEQDLATEFAGRLTAARSIPETAEICQEWMGRRMELLAEDNRRFVADIQKCAMATAPVLSNDRIGGSS
jgi:Phasin protein